tara:strand:- start:1468 stop:2169 length:702 start_codon:yes stop_codon:yes gene_type:complete
MHTTLMVADIAVVVHQKRIKNLHLKVLPPDGAVRVSAPYHFSLNAIRLLLIGKIGWIRAQQKKFADQSRQLPRQYVSGETHYFRGLRYQLKVIAQAGRSYIKIEGTDSLCMYVSPTLNTKGRQKVLDAWYRKELRLQLDKIVPKRVQQMQVPMPEYRIKKMKTRWGTCNIGAQRIWLNLELIKKPPECLEYVVVHELTHLLERTHNKRFQAFMTQFMPTWRVQKKVLNETGLE